MHTSVHEKSEFGPPQARFFAVTTQWNDFNRSLIEDMRAHGGRPTSGPFVGRQVLVLTTTGARTGETRETPLAYSRDEDDYVVVASKGGAPTSPDWYHNLVAHPEVTVEVLGERFNARAEVATGDEYERLYKGHADKMPAFWEYRSKTSRKIPVIVLRRAEQEVA
jgi:deazaflavin-dependent oxidoreductase (nitroreductase family)